MNLRAAISLVPSEVEGRGSEPTPFDDALRTPLRTSEDVRNKTRTWRVLSA
jgi:hypothetical protein